MLFPFKIVTSAAVAAATLFSGQNMIQTVSIARQHQMSTKNNDNTGTINIAHDKSSNDNDPLSRLESASTIQEVISQIQSMKRSDLIRLYLASSCPQSVNDIQGEWDGCLLNNNRLTTVSAFLTNTLFGKGRAWNGKEFFSTGKGRNRFCSSNNNNDIDYQHDFDYCLLGQSNINRQEQSMTLKYSNFQSPVSPWYSMVDEIRVVPLKNRAINGKVLIGMGSMAWSGGALNSSPFLLQKATSKQRREDSKSLSSSSTTKTSSLHSK